MITVSAVSSPVCRVSGGSESLTRPSDRQIVRPGPGPGPGGFEYWSRQRNARTSRSTRSFRDGQLRQPLRSSRLPAHQSAVYDELGRKISRGSRIYIPSFLTTNLPPTTSTLDDQHPFQRYPLVCVLLSFVLVVCCELSLVLMTCAECSSSCYRVCSSSTFISGFAP